jgi:hypothetical protein
MRAQNMAMPSDRNAARRSIGLIPIFICSGGAAAAVAIVCGAGYSVNI